MKSIQTLILYAEILLAAVVATSCAQDAPRDNAPTQAPAVSPTTRPGVILLPRQTLDFQLTRTDLTVGCVVFATGSSHPFRLNGAGFASSSFSGIYLEQLGPNRFELPAMTIEHAGDEPGQIFCMSIKLWFNEASNVDDGALYQRLDDRYALIAYCTSPPEKASDTWFKARFSMNRVKTIEEFSAALSRPIPVRLNGTPIRPEWGYPMVYKQTRGVSDADVKQAERIVRDRGEAHLISISIWPDRATVSASINDATRFHGQHVYHLARQPGGPWQVKSVETQPNPPGGK